MATRNIVPRATDEGKLGTQDKKWAEVNVDIVNATTKVDAPNIVDKSSFRAGTATIENKGVIIGCTLTKSTTVTRSVNLASGVVFAKGVRIPIPQKDACVVIPSNTSDSSKTCYVYLALSGSTWEPFCTALDETVPSGGISLYRATVPAGSTETSKPYLEDVTLTSTRRVESNAPMVFTSPPFVSVAFQYSMADSDYAVDLDIVSHDGSGFQLGRIYADERTANGFKIYADSMADNIQVRWTAKKLSL